MPRELQTLIRKYGRVPLIQRSLEVPSTTVRALSHAEGSNMGAAGLLWNEEGQVLLVVHDPGTQWRSRWTTPGGGAKPEEGPEETFLREIQEETGHRARILSLTCVYELTVTDGEDKVTGFFFQFEAFAHGPEPLAGRGISEVRWFDSLPENMAFRDDYLEAFRKRRGLETSRSG